MIFNNYLLETIIAEYKYDCIIIIMPLAIKTLINKHDTVYK